MIRSLAKIGFVLGLLAICTVGQSRGSGSGAVQGVLFTADADGGRSTFPTAKVSLDGPIHIQAQSDHEGKFGFSAVPVGSYTTVRSQFDVRSDAEVTVECAPGTPTPSVLESLLRRGHRPGDAARENNVSDGIDLEYQLQIIMSSFALG